MDKMKWLKKLFTFGWERQSPQERYLSQATDLVDLERRQKDLLYGNVNPNLKGWI